LTIPSDPEVGTLAWRKASISHAANNCVELAPVDGMVAIRNSKSPEGPILTFTAAEWHAFLDGAQTGEFDNLI
jgi:Domain of unknown function (DUF397)